MTHTHLRYTVAVNEEENTTGVPLRDYWAYRRVVDPITAPDMTRTRNDSALL